MKHKNIKYILVILASSFLWSCKKELNVFPTTSEVDGNVIVDTKSASTVLNGVYYRFANGGVDNNSVPSVLWTEVNETLPSEMVGTVAEPGGDDDYSGLTFTSASYGVDYMWNYGYQIVNAANGFLKNVAPVTTIPTATKKQMIAEAKFLRAFGNSELLLYYGQYYDITSKFGIILRNEFVSSSNINLPRSTVAASYAAIIADLDSAITDLPVKNSQSYYANVSAAKLLKARVLINRGSNGDYAEVASLTDDIITSKTFALEDSTKDVFLKNGLSSTEVVLGVQPFATETFKYQQYQFYGQYYASDILVGLLQNDPRNQWVYKNDGGGTIYGGYYGPLNEFTKYFSGNPAAPVQTPLSEACYAFRLTEVYLLEAESLTLEGGDLTKAKSLLEMVETHAGLKDFSAIENTTSASALQVLVIEEELKNFVGENGADWFAFRRLPFAIAQSIHPTLKTKEQLILPIPNSEIITNGNVVQNP